MACCCCHQNPAGPSQAHSPRQTSDATHYRHRCSQYRAQLGSARTCKCLWLLGPGRPAKHCRLVPVWALAGAPSTAHTRNGSKCNVRHRFGNQWRACVVRAVQTERSPPNACEPCAHAERKYNGLTCATINSFAYTRVLGSSGVGPLARESLKHLFSIPIIAARVANRLRILCNAFEAQLRFSARCSPTVSAAIDSTCSRMVPDQASP